MFFFFIYDEDASSARTQAVILRSRDYDRELQSAAALFRSNVRLIHSSRATRLSKLSANTWRLAACHERSGKGLLRPTKRGFIESDARRLYKKRRCEQVYTGLLTINSRIRGVVRGQSPAT